MAHALTKFEEDEPNPKIETLAITEITEDPEIIAREKNLLIVAQYAERMAEGDTFPPVQIVRDNATNFLFDGVQRLAAARRTGCESIECEVRLGSRRDAILASVSVNARHGLPRSNEDKRRAVLKLLHDREWSKWSSRVIAKRCLVSHTFVNEERITLEIERVERAKLTGKVSSERQYVNKHGQLATMDTANIGKQTTLLSIIPVEDVTPRMIHLVPRIEFGQTQMGQLEQLAEQAREATKEFASRLKKVGQKLIKIAHSKQRHKQARRKRS